MAEQTGGTEVADLTQYPRHPYTGLVLFHRPAECDHVIRPRHLSVRQALALLAWYRHTKVPCEHIIDQRPGWVRDAYPYG